MFIKLLVFLATLFTFSCSMQSENINYGTNKLNLLKTKIIKGKTSINNLIYKLGPPSIRNPYKKNIVYYISQNMKKNIANKNSFNEMIILEVILDEKNIVSDYKLIKNDKLNLYDINQDVDKNFKSRDKFNFFKDMLDSMRRNQKNK